MVFPSVGVALAPLEAALAPDGDWYDILGESPLSILRKNASHDLKEGEREEHSCVAVIEMVATNYLRTEPLEALSMVPRMFSNEVLPPPDGPRSITNSPLSSNICSGPLRRKKRRSRKGQERMPYLRTG